MTLQLFFNLHNGVQRQEHSVKEMTDSKEMLNFTTSNQDMILQSMEGLLEVSGECLSEVGKPF